VKRIIIASGIVCLTAILLISSCTKIDTTDLGNELIPAVDNVNTFEMVMDVITDNKLFNDTTRMLDGEYHGIGIIENDQEFGKTEATTYASFSPTTYRSYPFVNKDSVTIDSVVLSLAYTGSFGDSTSIQQFEVREIDGRFKEFKDSLYYLNAPDFDLLPSLLSTSIVHYGDLGDTGIVYKNGKDTIKSGSELRMKMDTTWARKFVNYDTTNAYKNDTLFKKVFAGLQIKASDASSNKNAIAYFNLNDNNKTRITFYCRVQNNGKTDTIAPYFAFYQDAHANIIRRTPANGYLANVTNSNDNDDKLYIQSTPGSFASARIPQMDTFSNCVINRAELIMEKAPSFDEFYAPPPYMFIEAISPTGDSAYTIRNDFVPVTTSPGYDLNVLGGGYKNNKYIFNLSRYFQSIVTKKFRNNTLRVYAPFTAQPYYMPSNTDQATSKVGIIINTPVAAGRVVLFGGSSADPKKMRLRIIYTKI
jgi:hypothetical protein